MWRRKIEEEAKNIKRYILHIIIATAITVYVTSLIGNLSLIKVFELSVLIYLFVFVVERLLRFCWWQVHSWLSKMRNRRRCKAWDSEKRQ